MQILKLPFGVFPDVISHNGQTYVAQSRNEGLYVTRIPDQGGAITDVYIDPNAGQLGWARFTIFNDKVLVAYKDQVAQLLRVVDILTGERLPIPNLGCIGNDPFCWDIVIPGLLTVQVPNPQTIVDIYQGVVPNLAKSHWTDYAPDGLSHSVQSVPVLKKDFKHPDMFKPTYAHNRPSGPPIFVGENASGGVAVSYPNNEKGVVNDGVYTGTPRGTLQLSTGKMAVVYWAPPEIEQNITLVYDISPEEIVLKGPEVNVPPLGSCAVGSFFCTSRQYGDFIVPGNFEMLLDGDDFNSMKIPRYVIAGELAKNIPDNMCMGYFATNEEVFGRIRNKRNPKAFVYTDSRDASSFRRFDGLYRSGDILMPQVYMNNVETLQEFEQDIAQQLDRLMLWYPNHKQMLVVGADDRGYHSDLTLQNMMPVYNRLVRRQNVVGMVFFSYGRPRGVIDHPSLRPWIEAFFRASSGLPNVLLPPTEPIPLPDGQKPPRVNIVHYDRVLRSNNHWTARVEDGNNPNTFVVIEFINGSLHVRLNNPKGSDRSGLQRIVNID